MPFYVSPEQAMKDKADFARKAITRARSGVVIDCDAGILLVSPNSSRALHKFSELYDRIAFAAAGRYNEFERLRQAGVRYADLTGYQYDRQDVTARGLANWYAQALGTIFTESVKPLEVEIVVAEVGASAELDQIYRITFDGTVSDEHHFLVMGGQTEQAAAVLKERYSEGMTLAGAMEVAIAALADQANGGGAEITGAQLEVALLDRSRSHRTFRRLTGVRLDAVLAEARSGSKAVGASPAAAAPEGSAGGAGPESGSTDASSTDASSTDAGSTDAGSTDAGGAG
ncbi:MAG TPA: proteasome subunit alpha [Streptosporangiaceae bacterium]